jgi:hypothetical protein
MTIPTSAGATGTSTFNPSAGDIVLQAFGKLQIRRHELTTYHLEDAAMEANLLMVDLTNRIPHRWLKYDQTIPLVLNTAAYALSANTVSVTIAYLSRTNSSDVVLGPISAADYAAMPQKTQSGSPSSVYFQLGIPPSVTVWPVPDAAVISAAGALKLMTWRQIQDVDLSGGQGFDSPYRYLDAIATGLAARLAGTYRPEREGKLEDQFEARIARAMKRDQENVNISIAPSFGSYYRQ